ncbi:hypothetical protein [Pseudomonas aeruginosa]
MELGIDDVAVVCWLHTAPGAGVFHVMVAAIQVQRVLVRISLHVLHAVEELSGAADDQQAVLVHRVQKVVLVRAGVIHHDDGLHLVLGRDGFELAVDGLALGTGNRVHRDGGGVAHLLFQALDHIGLLGFGQLLPHVRQDADFLDQALQQALAERVGGHVEESGVVLAHGRVPTGWRCVRGWCAGTR